MRGTVLLVDDANFMRMMLKDILQSNGYTVIGEAADGLKALEEYKRLSPDIVVMNITMPEMDGIIVTQKVTSYDPTARIIICSAMGHASLVSESLQAGARNFIIKPFQPDHLLTAMQNAINTDTRLNQSLLKRIAAECPDRSHTLSQDEIDRIITVAGTENPPIEKVNELINQLSGSDQIKPVVEPLPIKEPDSNDSRIIDLLSKLIEGQHEMATLLKQVAEAQKR